MNPKTKMNKLEAIGVLEQITKDAQTDISGILNGSGYSQSQVNSMVAGLATSVLFMAQILKDVLEEGE